MRYNENCRGVRASTDVRRENRPTCRAAVLRVLALISEKQITIIFIDTPYQLTPLVAVRFGMARKLFVAISVGLIAT